MKSALALSLVLICNVYAAQAPRVSMTAGRLNVTIRVFGDVMAVLVDARGRRTGYNNGWIEDIPGCWVEAIQDDVVEPRDYAFHFSGRSGDVYRLLVTPRLEDEVSIEIETGRQGKRLCFARADTDLTAGESQWRLHWNATRESCRVSINPGPKRKPR